MRVVRWTFFTMLFAVSGVVAASGQSAAVPESDSDRLYREGSFEWGQYQDEKLYAGRDAYFLFPHRYSQAKWRVRFRMFYMIPHARLPRPDGEGWFHWPFRNRPPVGCAWYRVPMRRAEITGPSGERVYRYARWRRQHLCFE